MRLALLLLWQLHFFARGVSFKPLKSVLESAPCLMSTSLPFAAALRSLPPAYFTYFTWILNVGLNWCVTFPFNPSHSVCLSSTSFRTGFCPLAKMSARPPPFSLSRPRPLFFSLPALASLSHISLFFSYLLMFRFATATVFACTFIISVFLQVVELTDWSDLCSRLDYDTTHLDTNGVSMRIKQLLLIFIGLLACTFFANGDRTIDSNGTRFHLIYIFHVRVFFCILEDYFHFLLCEFCSVFPLRNFPLSPYRLRPIP